MMAGWFYTKGATKIYEAEALVELSLRRPRILSREDALIDDSARMPSSEQFNTQLLKLEGPALRQAVAEELFRALPGTKHDLEDLLAYVTEHVDLELIRRTSLVSIKAASPNPDEAAFMANT